MKRFGSWLLILAFIADSMVHPLLFSVEYIVVQHSLSDLETQLAYEKSEQIGKSQTIIVLQETDARKYAAKNSAQRLASFSNAHKAPETDDNAVDIPSEQ